MRKVVILPFFGEFGWMVMSHMRYVEQLAANVKVVCCQDGEQCLFPSATSYYTDWVHPVPDSVRCGNGWYTRPDREGASREELVPILKTLYPDHEIVWPEYGCHWHWSDLIKPKLVVRHELPQVDVVLGVRKRQWVGPHNWQHWSFLSRALRSVGLTVGLAGRPDTSDDVEADVRAWDHPDGATAGSVDLMQHCGLYVGGDSGISHLAALVDTPMLVFRYSGINAPDQTGVMERANQGSFERLPDESWHCPDRVLGAVVRLLVATSEG